VVEGSLTVFDGGLFVVGERDADERFDFACRSWLLLESLGV